MPSAAVKVGCITNKQEAVLLGRQDYREKIALGIFNGILKAYELMEKRYGHYFCNGKCR